jgi:hypothetical protein
MQAIVLVAKKNTAICNGCLFAKRVVRGTQIFSKITHNLPGAGQTDDGVLIQRVL